MPFEHVCPQCGKAFSDYNRERIYCSQQCFFASIHNPECTPRSCAQCGKTFVPKRPDGRYCSRRCVWDAKFKTELIARPCKGCGVAFKPRRRTAEFCSTGCANRDKLGKASHNKVGLTTTCQVCGKEIPTTPSAQRKGQDKYCSRHCAGIALAKDNPVTQRKRIVRTCAWCGKEYEIIPAWVDTAKYCSRECHNAFKRTVRGEAHPLWKPPAVLTCTFCGKTYETKPSLAERSRFCSMRCVGAWISQHFPHPSSLERAISALLTELGIEFEPQKQIGPYLCDFAVMLSRLVIECDGSYWHGRPEQQVKDANKDTWLTRHGYTVLRLPEVKIKSDLDWCEAQIVSLITAHSADRPRSGMKRGRAVHQETFLPTLFPTGG